MATEEQRAYQREYYLRNREKKLAYQREWNVAKKDVRAAYIDRNAERLREQSKQYRDTNKERISERRRSWHYANRDEQIAKSRAYKEANREALLVKGRENYARNIEARRTAALAAYYANIEERRAKQREWQKADPIRKKQAKYARRALERNAGKFTARAWVELCERFDFKCLRCGDPEPNIKLTVDHVVPLVKGGSNTIDNIQPLCATCNTSKGVKTIDYRISQCAPHLGRSQRTSPDPPTSCK